MFHQKDRFGEMKKPSVAYANFRYLRATGVFHPGYTWEDSCAAYQKKKRKRKSARLSRRANRG